MLIETTGIKRSFTKLDDVLHPVQHSKRRRKTIILNSYKMVHILAQINGPYLSTNNNFFMQKIFYLL